LRIALFSDVHANLPALEAVLDDIEAAEVDDVYCLGDLVGYGPDPCGVVARIRRSGIKTIGGNHDDMSSMRRRRRTGTQAGPWGDGDSDGARSYAFTNETLTEADRSWLASLPASLRFEQAGLRVLLVHGSPRLIDEPLTLRSDDQLLAGLAAQAATDVVCVGHIHVPYHRQVSVGATTAHYVSSGSVGMPMDGDVRACWVELVIDPAGSGGAAESSAARAKAADPAAQPHVAVEVHRCAYDAESVAEAVLSAGLPTALADALRGL
jgi:predicted phosphodiesterase